MSTEGSEPSCPRQQATAMQRPSHLEARAYGDVARQGPPLTPLRPSPSSSPCGDAPGVSISPPAENSGSAADEDLQSQLSTLIERLHRRRAQGSLTPADENTIRILRRANPLIAGSKSQRHKQDKTQQDEARLAAVGSCGIQRLRYERFAHNSHIYNVEVDLAIRRDTVSVSDPLLKATLVNTPDSASRANTIIRTTEEQAKDVGLGHKRPCSNPTSSQHQQSHHQLQQAQPSQVQPSQAQPSQAQPSQAQPSQAQPPQVQPPQVQPSQAQPSQAQPSQAHSSQTHSSQTHSSQTQPQHAQPQTRLFRDLQQKCYVCKVRITQTHPFYDRLCDSCGGKNYSMRFITCDLKGKRAIVTGGRIKIGFEIALKLLRAGAEVVVTTRFPHDARIRFQAEADAADWLQRLHFYQLDLLSLAQVTAFTSHVRQRWSTIDIFICNAAQTIRRPADFFELPLRLEYSQQQTAESVRQVLPSIASAAALGSIVSGRAGGGAIQQPRPTSIGATGSSASADSACASGAPPTKRAKHEGTYCSGAVSEVEQITASRLAQHPHDEHGQPLDLRPRNTWDARLEEVPLMEAAECAVINYLSPFALLQGLHPLMRRSPVSRQPSAAPEPSASPAPPPFTPACTVLVSAMEGKFSCFKRAAHPHTNAAKAALNMLVRTSAPDFAANAGILLTAVDTGWITNEFASTDAARGVIHPPIDEIDAAARVLHPVFAAYHPTNPQHYKGVLLKDYSPTSW